MDLYQLKPLIESLLFVSDVPLGIDRIRSVVPEAGVDEIRMAVDELNETYRTNNHSFFISHIAQGYQLSTYPEYSPWINKLLAAGGSQHLSHASLETLAVVAYHQPVTRPQIETIRGVNCDGVLKTLLDKKLITLRGRAKTPGRPLLFATSREFLRYFGLNDLRDLPPIEEFEEMVNLQEAEAMANEMLPPEETVPAGDEPEKAENEAEESDEAEETDRDDGEEEIGELVSDNGYETDAEEDLAVSQPKEADDG